MMWAFVQRHGEVQKLRQRRSSFDSRLMAVMSVVALCLVMFRNAAAEPVAASLGLDEIELSVNDEVRFVYEPFSGLPSNETFSLEIKNRSSREAESAELNKQYDIRLRPSTGGDVKLISASNGELPLNVVASDSPALAQRNGAYIHSIGYSALSGKHIQLDYALIIPEHIWASPESYSLSFDIALVNTLDDSDVLALAVIDVFAIVNPKLQANLAGQVSSFEEGVDVAIVDFGTLETGESKRLFIQVRGNSPALISLSSENQGAMVHSLNPKWRVDYSVIVDGQISDLSSPLELKRSVKRNFRGSAYPMDINVGDVMGRFAGKYRDVITIDVNPL